MAGVVEEDATGLIDEIAQGALDDDYYEVRGGRYSRSRSYGTWRTAIVLAIFGALVTIAAVQTQANRSANQAQRSVLESSIVQGREQLAENNETLDALEDEILRLQQGQDAQAGELTKQGLIGMFGVQGPGVSVALSHGKDRINVYDIQKTVNALWQSGAEAVSVNGERLTTLSAIQTANTVVMVNYRAISAPYVVLAIGGDLESGFSRTAHGKFLQNRRNVDGISIEINEYDQLYIGPAPQNRVTLKSAKKGQSR